MVASIGGIAGGRAEPLGATVDADGVNFALFSAHAEKVEVCLFDHDGQRETARLALLDRTEDVWHGYLPGARAGLLYGYRVHGPYDPCNGHRFNPNKLLIDPYARALDRAFAWNDIHCGYIVDDPRLDLSFDPRDNADLMPKCRIVDNPSDEGDVGSPATAPAQSVIYELHVRGYTMLHPSVEPALRGTFAALAHPEIVGHLRDLGVTSVELLPVHPIGASRRLFDAGLRDYWGYNSIAYFALEHRYLSGGDIAEFRRMVRAFHAAGIEVILDVVFNHTGEGDELGPTLSFRGIDNASYYCLAEDRRRYLDVTGCHNTLNFEHPRVIRMVVDALRYWADVMHVDGFRFDLAVTLARRQHHFSRTAGFFTAVAGDPVLAKAKLIAEPWDLGVDGYQLGSFPQPWSEWNDRFRDTVRRFWRGDPDQVKQLAYRLSGSSDLFEASGRKPCASVNFVTAHDGFTLADLVSYTAKRNDANGEGNRNGAGENFSANCGIEGPTADEGVLARRRRQRRNLLATLALSRGIPMLLAGDEIGHTQQGNNNAYAQDNPISWIDWRRREAEAPFLRFVRRVLTLRKTNPVFRDGEFFRGESLAAGKIKDIAWLTADGREMTESDWHAENLNHLAILYGVARAESSGDAEAFLLLMNASERDIDFTLPLQDWRCILDTRFEDGAPVRADDRRATYVSAAHSLAVLAGHGP